MATFETLRLSLSVKKSGGLLKAQEISEPNISRQDYLKAIFSKRIDFFHKGKIFSYVPSPTNLQNDDILSGYIGKQVEIEVQSGPNQFFAVTKEKHWRASFLAIDTSSDQQMLFFEKRSDVGSAKAVLYSMIVEFVKEFKGYAWHTDIEYITKVGSFWDAVNANRGSITELIFEFVPPNVLRGYDKMKELDKMISGESNSERSSYVLKNQKGELDPKGEFVEDAAKYAAEGAGGITLKSGRKTIYDNSESKKTETVSEEMMPRECETTKILGLINFLFKRK